MPPACRAAVAAATVGGRAATTAMTKVMRRRVVGIAAVSGEKISILVGAIKSGWPDGVS